MLSDELPFLHPYTGLSKRNAATFLTHSSSGISENPVAKMFFQMPVDAAYRTIFIL
jgi:hypothetical protein